MKQFLQLVPLLAVIVGVGGPCVVIIMTWNKAPWWRTNPTPRRQINVDRDLIRIYKIRKRHPEVFNLDPSPAQMGELRETLTHETIPVSSPREPKGPKVEMRPDA